VLYYTLSEGLTTSPWARWIDGAEMMNPSWTLDLLWLPWFGVAFLVGSIPFGRLIGRRVARIDITRKGSGNIGATNVAREIGLRWGILTLLLDVLKGFLPSLSFRILFPESGLGLSAMGVFALLGHQFTPFLRFRGGKGVATALGFYFAVSPLCAALALCVFLVFVYLWDFVSVGSMAAALSVPLFLFFLCQSAAVIGGSLFVAGLICLKHRDNIRRLVAGKERRWRQRRLGS
jgi:acyl phosphate:glycerol-3-phosphate acyltransferase